MDGALALPLRELIASGCLSESTLIYEHEANELGGRSEDERRRHLNAAKVATMLAKSFFDGHSKGAVQLLEPDYLLANGIFVCLRCTYELSPSTGGKAAQTSEQGARTVSDGSSAFRRDDDSDASSFDEAIDELFSEEGNAESGGNAADQRHDRLGGAPICADRDGPSANGHGADTAGCSADTQWVAISDVASFRLIDRAKMRHLRCTLLDVGVAWGPPLYGSPPVGNSAAMQLLGELVHAVFAQGHRPSQEAQLPQAAPEPGSADAVPAGAAPRPPKQRRNRDDSLFAALAESGQCPIAVCRLLSDMIDDRADAPIASFEEVIRDLEQMSSSPDVHLYDPSEGFLDGVHFGRGHYGRVAEVTKVLEVSTRMEQSARTCGDGQLETVFISGIAGIGKTHLARRAGDFLSGLGWISVQDKFDGCAEHQSREVIFSLLDKLVSKLADMKQGDNKEDQAYGLRAAKELSEAFDASNLWTLANHIPSIHDLVDDVSDDQNDVPLESHWQLIFMVSKLLGTVLRLGRFITICLDDLQWCDEVMLTLIKEVLAIIAQQNHERQYLLFMGTYRHNEVDDAHPLTTQVLSNLRISKGVNVTQLCLSSLTTHEISHMLQEELRLPNRLVWDLAQVVNKKTYGHAIYVVELLNSFLRDSIISYSPQKRRFDWDLNKVSSIKTGDNVATLIISTISSLEPNMLNTLYVLSCFGYKADASLLMHLRGLELVRGFTLDPDINIASLVSAGFVELSGSVVSFSHDLIRQHVFGTMPIDQRRSLHLAIGTSLATGTTLDSSPSFSPIEGAMEELYICVGDEEKDDGSSSALSLGEIATSQINKAGPENVPERTHRIRFARWNLRSAREMVGKSNFHAVLYFCKNGIVFLEDDLWGETTCQLSVELHEGMAFASIAVGNLKDVAQYARRVIDSDKVQFEQTLVAESMLIRSLEATGRYADAIDRGLAVLRRLNFNIPTGPSPTIVQQAMAQTGTIASQCNFHLDPNQTQAILPKQRNILRIIDSVAVACFRSASPYLPLVACATVLYSLQHGLFHCEESASAFAIFGYFQVFLESKYAEGRKWGNLVMRILARNRNVRARFYLFGFLFFWYQPITMTCQRLHETYTLGMRCGDVDTATYALCASWLYQFYGGEKLSIVNAKYEEVIQIAVKHNIELAKQAVLRKIIVNELIGLPDEDPFQALHDSPDIPIISNEAELCADAKLNKSTSLMEAVYLTRFLSSFWSGDFLEALESSKAVSSLPTSKMPKIQAVYHTFYSGIVKYRLFREGKGQHLMAEANEVLSKVQLWRQTCDWIENKMLLLEAEHSASSCNRNAALEKYEAAAQAARDRGFLHEQGLAYECMGEYLSSIVEMSESRHCLSQAISCYLQWGATGKAEMIRIKHGLGQETVNVEAKRKHGSSPKSG